MSGWDGSGTYTRAYDWTNERDAGNNIDATKFDAENDAFAAGINNCIAKDGQNAATGDLPMGGNKHTGVADGSALTHYASCAQAQNGSMSYATAGGTANAITVTLAPAPADYSLGMIVSFYAASTNTAACTLNVNGIGATDLRYNGVAVGAGFIRANRGYTALLVGGVGVYFEIINPPVLGAQAELDTPQAINAAATGSILLDTDVYDPDELHSVASNTDRVLTPIAGLWTMTAHVDLAVAPSGNGFIMWIAKNGAAAGGVLDSTEQYGTITASFYATATTDYASIRVLNNEAGQISVTDAKLSVAFIR